MSPARTEAVAAKLHEMGVEPGDAARMIAGEDLSTLGQRRRARMSAAKRRQAAERRAGVASVDGARRAEG